MHRILLFIFLLFLQGGNLFSQNRFTDSLLKENELLKSENTYTADTTRINILLRLGREFINVGAYNKADTTAIQVLELCKKNLTRDNPQRFCKEGVGKALSYRGIVASCKGESGKALEFFYLSLDQFTQLGHKTGISKNLGYLGNVFKDQGNYSRALEHYFKALKLSESLNDQQAVAIHLANIGNVYKAQQEYSKSLDYYFKGLALAEKMKDIRGIAADLSNIGIVYKAEGQLDKALEYYFKALEMAEKLDYKLLIINTLGNIGSVYSVQKKYQLALEYFEKAMQIAETVGDKAAIARITGNIATVYLDQKKLTEAEKYLKTALELENKVGDLNILKEQHNSLSRVYEQQGKWQAALQEYKLFVQARDSIFNDENTKRTLRSELNFEFEKKATADSVKNAAEQQLKDAAIQAQQAELRQEKTQRYSLYGGLIMVLIFAGFLFNRFQITNKQKKVIEHQKVLVEQKNKEVIDSINYARRIQDALLKQGDQLHAYMPEHFILFKAKDIVSGDFYWSAEKSGYLYFCVADSTGHGVPGAFMSMLGIAYLNEINAAKEILHPGEILDQLREKIVKDLKQKGESGESKDGMDISLIRYHLQKRELEWAGANNPLWICRKESNEKTSITEIKPDKQPIGYTISPLPFITHTVSVHPGDHIYLFTDGYADQFGGEKGKKFKYKQLQEKIIAANGLSLPEQKDFLDRTFENWKGNLEQLDDVALIGIRF
jgi:tetratricopeptide (TPR) repeat protein